MKRSIVLISGVVFGVGLVLSGMTQPSKVVGFLDFFGDWDPSLAFVMGGAVLVNIVLFRLIFRRKRPLFAEKFHLPTRSDIDWQLVTGAAFFGVGWGIAGYCPGPAITSMVSLQAPAFIFVIAMAAGMFLFSVFQKQIMNS